MPLYDYKCSDPECGMEFEAVLPIEGCDTELICSDCGNRAQKIIVLGHGGIQKENPDWIKSINSVFTDGEIKKPLETISDLRKFYRDNPNIRPKESHPALPSSLECESPPDQAQIAAERKKTGMKKLADLQRVSVQ